VTRSNLRKRIFTPCLRTTTLLAMGLWMVSRVSGQDFPAHLVTSDAIALVHVDLDKVDVDQLMTEFLGEQRTAQEEESASAARAFLTTFRDAGASHVYLSVSAAAIPNGGVSAIVPCRDGAAIEMMAKALMQGLPKPLDYAVLNQKDRLVICPSILKDRFAGPERMGNLAVRPELLEAYQSTEGSAHQLLIGLPKDIRGSLGRVFPDQLDAPFPADFSLKNWVKSVRSAAVGLTTNPTSSVKLTLVCDDRQSAQAGLEETMRVAKVVPGLAEEATTSVTENVASIEIAPQAMVGLLANLGMGVRQAARESQTANDLKQIALAMHNYYDVFSTIPPKAIRDKDGKPLLSWRVHLLPFIEQGELYKKFRLDEPWDSEHNLALVKEMPPVYENKIAGAAMAPGTTCYRLPVMPGSVWEGNEPLKFNAITDGTSNTIWTIAAPTANAVVWTKPDDWVIDANNIKKSIFGDASEAWIGRMDGWVEILPATVSEDDCKHLLQYADGNVVLLDK
jgi:hypothetical protein